MKHLKQARPATKTVVFGGALTLSLAFAGLQGFAGQEAPKADRAEMKAHYQRNLEIDYPDDNQPNEARIALGKSLFFDPRLSRSGGQSCSSCHNPSFSWGDGMAVGVGDGLKPLARRSPTVLNLAWSEPLMWDGRADSLEDQALGPLLASVEMNLPVEELIERLEGIEGYSAMFKAAYDGDGTISGDTVARAIAAFERTIVSGQAPFDDWVDGDETAISEQAKEGFELFNGKAKCASCHEGWRFTDDSFHDVGLETEDPGRGKFFPKVVKLQHAFKTPGLRDIARRGPYMHAGQVPTLRDVVVHYNEGGIDRPSRSDEIFPLGLTDAEIDALVAFMETLTGDNPDIAFPVLPQ